MSKKQQTKKQSQHKYYGNTVKKLQHQMSVVNINQAKLFHAMLGNLHHAELAINIDVSRYVNPADLYPYDTVKLCDFHCEHGFIVPARVNAQVASLGYNARKVYDLMGTLVKSFEDGTELSALHLYNADAIVGDMATFVEALWEACAITVKNH